MTNAQAVMLAGAIMMSAPSKGGRIVLGFTIFILGMLTLN